MLTSDSPPPPRTATLASQVTTAWISQPEYLDADGRPRPLPMRATDDAPSFERLSQAVSKDFHARSVLDELVRLGVVEAPVDDGWTMWMRLRDALSAGDTVVVPGDRVMPGQRGRPVPSMSLPPVTRMTFMMDCPAVQPRPRSWATLSPMVMSVPKAAESRAKSSRMRRAASPSAGIGGRADAASGRSRA